MVPSQTATQMATKVNVTTAAVIGRTGSRLTRYAARTSQTDRVISTMDSRKCSATTNGLSWVSTVMPPITPCAGIPSAMAVATRRTRRRGCPSSRARMAVTQVRTAITISTKVSSRLPNSIAPCSPSAGWAM